MRVSIFTLCGLETFTVSMLTHIATAISRHRTGDVSIGSA